ncbi:MAG: hypothetical protein ACNS63_07050 [Candidatus Nitrospinota bacterium M3_3B_026]
MDIRKIAAALMIAAFAAGCASAPRSADRGREDILRSDGFRVLRLKAESVVFNAAGAQTVTSKSFTSEVEVNVHGDIRSYKFTNTVKAEDEARTTTVLVAISGTEGGVGIYGEDGSTLAEYAKGRLHGDALIFDMKRDDGSNMIKWLFGRDTIASVIETFDSKGKLIYSEITVYRPR